MAFKKTVTINENLNNALLKYQKANPGSKINLSRVFQDALEEELKKRND